MHNICGMCGKEDETVIVRQYVVPSYFGIKPITSKNPLCEKCDEQIKKGLNIK